MAHSKTPHDDLEVSHLAGVRGHHTNDSTSGTRANPSSSTPKDGGNDADDSRVASEPKPSSSQDLEQTASPTAPAAMKDTYLTGTKLIFAFTAMLFSIFLVALDQTITSTAIPKIASQFDALAEVTWVASAYFLTQAGFLMLFGQLLVIAPTKWVYIVAIAVFEAGSLVCGAAPTINVLIFGRALAGVGAAGIFVSILTIVAQVTRLEDRPVLLGSFGGVYAVSSVIGPLLGGIFSDHVTWRWCFYINLPIGAVSIAVVLLLIDARPAIGAAATDGTTTAERWLKLDWLGALLSVGMVASLILPLQWGGNEKAWNDPAVISLFCVFGVILAIFVVWQWYRGPLALVPPSLIRSRTQIGSCLEAFFIMLSMLVATYYLPLSSGIDILPFMLSVVITSGLAGAITNFTGHYWIFLCLSPLLSSVGSGLLFTLGVAAPAGKMIGYQILLGTGVGGALQSTIIAVQAEHHDNERMVPQATSLVTFAQLIGGVVGISIAGTVFANRLTDELAVFAPGLPVELVQSVRASVTVIDSLPPDIQGAVIQAYTQALDFVYLVGVPAGVLASTAALLIRRRNIKMLGIQSGPAA